MSRIGDSHETKRDIPMATNRERGLKQLPDGRWEWTYYYEGKQHRHIARTKSEARAYLEKVRTEIREGRHLDKKKEVKVTFDEVVGKFLVWSKANVRPSTYTGDCRISKIWLTFQGFAGKRLSAITPVDVEAYKAFRVKDVSQRSTDYELARLKRLFSLCEIWELCEKNPVKKVKLFNPECIRTRFLTYEEEAQVMEKAPDSLKPCIIFALETGLRLREMLLLTWKQVDFKQGQVTVTAMQAKGKRTRHIPMSASTRAALESLPRGIDPNTLVFAQYGGILFGNKKKNAHSFYRQWLDTLEAAGLKGQDICWHSLRHTFASRLASASVPLPVIQKLMGHRSIAMVMRYAHMGESDMKAAIRVLDTSRPQVGDAMGSHYSAPRTCDLPAIALSPSI
jgi:integrase